MPDEQEGGVLGVRMLNSIHTDVALRVRTLEFHARGVARATAGSIIHARGCVCECRILWSMHRGVWLRVRKLNSAHTTQVGLRARMLVLHRRVCES